ncbi:MAG: hypothetical protein V4601_07390 [Pseudomonadota bacterium]
MKDDFQRAQDAIASLRLTGHNRDLAGQWLSFWKNGKPPPLETYRRLTWLHTEATMISRIVRGKSLECVSAGPYLNLAMNFDLAGKDILTLVPPDQRDVLLSHWWEVAEGAVSLTYREFKPKESAPGIAQNLGLPFSGEEADGARHVLMHSNWRPSGSSWIAGNVETGMLASTRQLARFRGP